MAFYGFFNCKIVKIVHEDINFSFQIIICVSDPWVAVLMSLIKNKALTISLLMVTFNGIINNLG